MRLILIKKSFGDFGEVDPPVPISNTEVKRFSAYDTALARVWENMSLPRVFLCSKDCLKLHQKFTIAWFHSFTLQFGVYIMKLPNWG